MRVVAAALTDANNRVLIAQRPAGKDLAGWWEFPGGKVAAGESDRAALVRELAEELGIRAEPTAEIAAISHTYADRIVDLALWQVSEWFGEPRGLDGQALKWVAIEALGAERILEADRPLIEALRARRGASVS